MCFLIDYTEITLPQYLKQRHVYSVPSLYASQYVCFIDGWHGALSIFNNKLSFAVTED